ncbi:MAG: bifunctional demethylmenaquinone methyltransferase/2-methoxy-6-polyprenyl-1,4-benzoquinol methylase UbiE [Bdellovibrionota bacterium]
MSQSLQPMTRPESEAKVATMFDLIAKRYDFLNRLLSAGQDRRWRNKLLSYVPKSVNGVFVDVATGTGDVILGVRQTHPEYRKLIGVDISDNMLELANQKAKSKKYTNEVEFKNMSAEQLAIPDNSVDCLSIAFGLRNVLDKEKAISEFKRVLKPDGTLLILEFFLPQKGSFSTLFQFYFHKVLPKVGGLFSSREAYTYLPKSVDSFYSLAELEKKLASQNLQVTNVVSWLFGSCRLVKASKLYSTQAG